MSETVGDTQGCGLGSRGEAGAELVWRRRALGKGGQPVVVVVGSGRLASLMRHLDACSLSMLAEGRPRGWSR